MRERTSMGNPGYHRTEPKNKKSIEWAQWWRANAISEFKDVDVNSQLLKSRIEEAEEYSVWTRLNREDGSRFSSFVEFCEYPEPHGLGVKFSFVKPILEAVHGKLGAKLLTVSASAEPGGARRDRVLTKRSSSTDNKLARLKRDRPEVVDQIGPGKKHATIEAAWRACGFGPSTVDRIMKLVEKLSKKERADLENRMSEVTDRRTP